MQLKLTWDFNKMKALITASLFIFSIFNMFAQPIIEWQKSIGGDATETMNYTEKVFLTSDGGYILGGTSASGISGNKSEANIGSFDYWVIKLDGTGTIQWQNTIGGTGGDYLNSIIQTVDGGYLLGGYSDSGISGDKTEANIGGRDYWAVKLDANGSIQWQNTIGGTGFDDLRSVVQTNDGGYILGGTSDSGISGDKLEANIGSQDYWVVKLDGNGTVQWENTIGGANIDYLISIIQTDDNGFLLGGYSNSGVSGDKTEATQGSYDYWVIKLNQTGTIEWQNTIGGNDYDRLHSICKTNDGDYVLGGSSRSLISGDKTEQLLSGYVSYDYWIIKIDNLGQIIWQNTIGGYDLDECYSIEPTIDGGYIIGGKSKTNNFSITGDQTEYGLGLDDFWVVKIDGTGTLEWQNKIGGSADDRLYTVKQTTDSGFILVGTSNSGISGDKTEAGMANTDYWVVKLAPDCTLSSYIMNELSDITSTCSVTPIVPSATDNCGNIHYATSNVSFPIETIGLTVVTWTYSYMNNTATQTQNVYITEPVNQTVSPLSQTICANSPATINVSSSEIGIDYYLRDDSNDSVIVGPIAGSGSAINFTVPSISSTTLYNVYAEKSINDALDFDGINDYVFLPLSVLLGLPEGTIETWINLDALNDEPIFSCSSGSNYYVAFTIGKYVAENGVLTAGIPGIVYFHSKNGTPTAMSNTPITSGTWFHVAVSFSSTGASIYINGVLDATTLGDFSYPSTGGANPYISRLYTGRLDGRVDELRFWDIQKTEFEISSNSNACFNGNEPNLRAYYKFNDGIEWGAIVRDASISNYQGTMSNFDLTTAWVPGIENCSSICFKEMDQIASVIVPNIPPTITCPDSQTRNTDINNCSYNVIGTEFDPSFNDDCPGAFITNNYNGTNTLAGAVFPIGTTMVIWNVYDAAGNWGACSFNVTVNNPAGNLTGGTYFCPATNNNTTLTLSNFSGTIQQWEVSTDNTNWTIIANTTSTYEAVNVIQNSYYRVLVNTSGCLMYSDIATIYLNTQFPIVNCPSSQTRNANANDCFYTAQGGEFDPSYSDNCPGVTLSNNYNGANTLNGANFPIGTTGIVWYATNATGQTAACYFEITVEDNNAPTFSGCADVTISNTPGTCSATVNFEMPTAIDNCATAPMIPGYTVYGSFDNSIYYRSNGMLATTVQNNQQLIAQGYGANILSINNAAENTFIQNIRNDLGELIIPFSDAISEGTFVWNDGSPITYTNWNSGEPNNYQNNEDNVQMILSGQWNDIGDYLVGYYILEWIQGTMVPTQTAGLPSGSTFPVGTTTNTFQATDAAGNTSTCSFNVVVEVPVVTNLGVTNILPDAATINWNAGAALGFGWYSFRYKQTSSGTWFNYGTVTGSAISKLISGLSPGTEYEAQIKRHANAQCTSAWSSSVIFTTTSSGCGAPMLFNTPTQTYNSVTLTWTAVSGAAWYEFQYKEASSGTWINAGTLTGIATSKLFTGLSAGTVYNFRGRTFCPGGTPSSWSITANVTTSSTASGCSLPPVVAASSVSGTSSNITWPAVAGAGWYTFRYSSVSSSGPWTNTGSANAALTSKLLTGLSPNTTYYFEMRTHCPNGQASAYNAIQFTTTALEGCELPPVLTVSVVTTTASTITWPSVAGAAWYTFQYRQTGSPTWISAGSLNAASPTTKTLTGLIPDTQYDFQAKTFCSNGIGSAWSTTLQFTTGSLMPMAQKPGTNVADNKAIQNTNIAVNVYPNPTSGLVNIETIFEEADAVIRVKVIDMNGRIVFEMNTLSAEGKNNIQLSLENLNVGIYNLELYNNNELIDRSKVIKTN